MRLDLFAHGLPDVQDIPAIGDYAHSGGETHPREEVYDTPAGLVHKRCLGECCRDEGASEDELESVLAENERPPWAELEVIVEDIEDLRYVPVRTLLLTGCTNEDALEHIIKEA